MHTHKPRCDQAHQCKLVEQRERSLSFSDIGNKRRHPLSQNSDKCIVSAVLYSFQWMRFEFGRKLWANHRGVSNFISTSERQTWLQLGSLLYRWTGGTLSITNFFRRKITASVVNMLRFLKSFTWWNYAECMEIKFWCTSVSGGYFLFRFVRCVSESWRGLLRLVLLLKVWSYT